MRLFTGLDLPERVAVNLNELMLRLKPVARIHWSPAANLHVTAKFIGEWPQERLGELTDAVRRVPWRPPIAVKIRGVGFFPNPHAPRVFWCGIEAPQLPGLAADIDNATAALGIAREKRAFSPHLTLARIKGQVELQALRKAIAGLDSLEFGDFEARKHFLYQSILGPTGSVYTKLAEFPLTQS